MRPASPPRPAARPRAASPGRAAHPRTVSPPAPRFEIWQGDGRVASIDNTVRLQILHALETRPATLGTLVKITGRAKSTLSTLHLRPLLQLGLVAEAPDPKDARVKWYSLKGSRLGSSAVAPAQLRDAVLGYVQGSGLVPLRPVLDILDLERLVQGPEEYGQAVARRLGSLIGRMLTSPTPAGKLAELDAVLRREKLGTVQGRPDHPQVSSQVPGAAGFLAIVAQVALGSQPS